MNLERVTAPKATFPRVRQPINGGSSMALAAQTRNRPVLTTVRIGTKMISWKLTLLVEDWIDETRRTYQPSAAFQPNPHSVMSSDYRTHPLSSWNGNCVCVCAALACWRGAKVNRTRLPWQLDRMKDDPQFIWNVWESVQTAMKDKTFWRGLDRGKCCQSSSPDWHRRVSRPRLVLRLLNLNRTTSPRIWEKIEKQGLAVQAIQTGKRRNFSRTRDENRWKRTFRTPLRPILSWLRI